MPETSKDDLYALYHYQILSNEFRFVLGPNKPRIIQNHKMY